MRLLHSVDTAILTPPHPRRSAGNDFLLRREDIGWVSDLMGENHVNFFERGAVTSETWAEKTSAKRSANRCAKCSSSSSLSCQP